MFLEIQIDPYKGAEEGGRDVLVVVGGGRRKFKELRELKRDEQLRQIARSKSGSEDLGRE